MTENEAIERLRSHRIFMQINDCYAKENYNKFGELAFEANAMAIKALEEIQQYRAIGTVEECREARERQMGKKPLQGEPYTWISSVRVKGRYRDVRKTSCHHVCPNCRENVAMDMSCCKYCGQSIDWSDTP